MERFVVKKQINLTDLEEVLQPQKSLKSLKSDSFDDHQLGTNS